MDILNRVGLVTLLSASASLAACGGGAGEANESLANEVDSNVMFEQLGNDASALEAASNAAPIDQVDVPAEANGSVPGNPVSSGNSSQPAFGETQGGDTGGNIIQGNVSGQ